jgi:hypothetical protein
VKFVEPSPFTNPDAAARRLVEIASMVEAVPDWSTVRSSTQAARRISSAPRSPARSSWVGYSGTKAGPM